MLFSSGKKTGLMAGLFISAFSISGANAVYAQSATAGVSDTDYLSALTTMATDMDLDGLAGQTFEPATVVAPQLPMMASDTEVVLCETLQAQAEETGRPIEIFGDPSALSESELAALSKCAMPNTDVLVSYLILAN